MRYICTSIVATLILAGTSLAATINVPADYTTIQAAVDAASDGDEIVIAPGTYTGNDDAVVDLGSKQLTLRGSGSADSILIDGEFSRRAVIAGTNSPNTGSTIQNLTLTKGFGDSMGGGGLLLGGSSNITCIGCRFTGNTTTGSGAGIGSGWSYNTVSLTNCLFDGNSCLTVGNRGGAVGGITNIDAADCTFVSNSASTGGSIDIRWGTSNLTNCVFQYNTAIEGGAIAVFGNVHPTIATISQCLFQNNTAELNGGGTFCAADNALFENCHFESNSANSGAGAYTWYEEPAYDGCTFISHNGASTVFNRGSGSDFCSPSFESCIVEANNSGGVYTYFGNPNFTNCAIRNNEGYGVQAIDTGGATIIDSTICGNASGQIYGPWDGEGNTINDVCDNDSDGVPDDLDNCYLYNPDQADCNENGIGDICDIADGVSEDINGNEIPDECDCLADVVVDGEVNINDVLVTISSWGTSGPLGDVNYDGIVDVEDLLIVISAWGPCP
jgi:hypothetical protein